MNNLEMLNSLVCRFEFNIEVCSVITHDHKWLENSSKKCYDIWLITDGEIELDTSDKTSILQKGDAFLFYPNKLYTASSRTENCTFIFIRFDVLLGKNIRTLNSFAFSGLYRNSEIKSEASEFVQEFAKFQNDEPMSGLLIKGRLILLFAKMASIRLQSGENKTDEYSPYVKLEEAMLLISENVGKDISVKKIARYLCISEKYFISYFKKYAGVTPYVYITKHRLNLALKMLNEQKYSVKEIAALVGYSDQYTFSKAFKRYYGFSPSDV